MADLDKHPDMLQSPNASVRYDVCEGLMVASESSPEVIGGLGGAAHDENKDVAEREIQALHADAHKQMAIQMGKDLKIFESQPDPDIVPKPENPNKGCITTVLALLLLPIAFLIGAFGLFMLAAPNDGQYYLFNYFGCVIFISGLTMGVFILIKGIRGFLEMPP